jgi:hypothetical protein
MAELSMGSLFTKCTETFATSLSAVPILSTTLGYFAATNNSKYAALQDPGITETATE